MTEEEIERRVAISDKLVTVHKELLTKRQAAKVRTVPPCQVKHYAIVHAFRNCIK